MASKTTKNLAKSIYSGKVTLNNLPISIYNLNKNKLHDQIKKVVTKDSLRKKLNDNLSKFSAAKTYQQTREMIDGLKDENDNMVKFKHFYENVVTPIYDLYNDTYLETESTTALANAQICEQWDDIQDKKQYLPMLRYSTVGDDNVDEDICEPLDDLVAPVDDPIWDTIMPTNHFNCRCVVEQIEYDESNQSEIREKQEYADSKIPDEFKVNVGKQQVIFTEKHPYFNVDEELLKTNFNLPI